MSKTMLMAVVILLIMGVSFGAQAQENEIVEFPVLTGEYQVGHVAYHMIDEDRAEVFTGDLDDVRELMVTIYYPATPDTDAQPAPYVEGIFGEVSTRIWPLPWDQIISHSFVDVPVSESKPTYPVLLFSPGFTMNPVFYTALIEEVTSQGYIVVVLTHPYCVDAVVFPDDHVIYMNDYATRLLRIDRFQSRLLWANAYNDTADVWVKDAFFVLDQLAILNENDALLAGHMDLTHVGMFGHSFGGTASAEAAYRDDRILAVINIDGLLLDNVLENGISQPYMVMISDMSWQTGEDRFGLSDAEWDMYAAEMPTQAATLCENSDTVYKWTLRESAHGTFHDVALLEPLGRGDEWYFNAWSIGRIDARRAHEVTSTYVVAFFNKYVKGEDVQLLDSPSDNYPEVVFEACGS